MIDGRGSFFLTFSREIVRKRDRRHEILGAGEGSYNEKVFKQLDKVSWSKQVLNVVS